MKEPAHSILVTLQVKRTKYMRAAAVYSRTLCAGPGPSVFVLMKKKKSLNENLQLQNAVS